MKILPSLGRISRVARAIISIVITVMAILFLYGYLSPFGLSPISVFGPEYGSFFGNMTSGATGFGAFGFGPLVPGGVVGLIAYTVLSRIGSVTAAATAPSMRSPDEIMRRMNLPGMFGGMGAQAAVPQTLPADITRSQFVVLQYFRQGYKNPKEIGRVLSMDKNEVEKESSALKSNGYLSKEGRLTSKAMELLGS
jgi:hypothetical protein